MKANEMFTGQRLVVANGEYAGNNAVVVDPTVAPDHLATDENRRKVLVDITFEHDGSVLRTYILPRSLEDPNAPKPVVTKPDQYMPVQAHDHAALTFIEHGDLVQSQPITDPMDPALDEFRPNPDLAEMYVSRTLPGGLSDIDFLLHMRDQRNSDGYSPNVALVGETQSGKTMLVQVLAIIAAQRDGLPKPYPVFTLNGSMGITSYDLFGQPSAVIIDGRETLVWMDGLVPRAVNCGGFLYLDEWNAVAPQQATALHPVLDDRRQFVNLQKAVPDGHGGFRPEIVKAHPNLWVISTINPGYKGTQSMAEASTNRFNWFSWDYDPKTEETLVPSPTVRMVGNALRQARNERAITVPVGTSALQRFNSNCATFGIDTAVWGLVSMFPPNERARVTTIMEDRGFIDLLKAEYPTPVFGTQSAPEPSEAVNAEDSSEFI